MMSTMIISFAVQRLGTVEKNNDRTPYVKDQRGEKNQPDKVGAAHTKMAVYGGW